MAQSYIHAETSARKFGGQPEDYLAIHEWIDRFKSVLGDVRHRAMVHHAQGPWMCQEVFGRFINIHDDSGDVILAKSGKPQKVLVRDIAENHIIEDMGCLPTIEDWLCNMTCRTWMGGKRNKFIGREELLDAEVKIPTLQRSDASD
jgi:hypothetical protein